MHMGRKLTVLWDERELGNSVMLFTCFCCCYCTSQCALPTQCPIGHLVSIILEMAVVGEHFLLHFAHISDIPAGTFDCGMYSFN